MENAPQLGFGIMRLPKVNQRINYQVAEEIIREYMRGGYCYFDLHPEYMDGQAQNILREMVVNRYPRDSFIVANKIPCHGIASYKEYERILTKELVDCGINYFDYYMLHAVTRDVYEMHERLGGFNFLRECKNAGMVKHIGFSFHDKAELLEEILCKHPEIDFVQLQINFLDWDDPVIQAKKCYDVARKYNKSIMVMEPIKGGSLTSPVELDGQILSASEMAKLSLEYVAALPGIQVILSGMSDAVQVRENRATITNATEILDREIYDKLTSVINGQKRIQCTSCGYCMSECPKRIQIPDILSTVNANRLAASGGNLVMYHGIVHGKSKASDCVQCGLCEKRCPQKINIRKWLKEAVKMFEDGKVYCYTTERNIQILIYLMKVHGIRKIIVSPGTTNASFVYSVQQDRFFELYSAADERSAAYMACGLAEESGEAVALSCTGATASRNYVSGLTEAYYRKLPILAITSTQPDERIGHNFPQVIDRTNPLNDIARISVSVPSVKDWEDEWACEVAVNKAILGLWHRGGGPVHINLGTTYSMDYSVRNLPTARVINRIVEKDVFPEMPKGKICIFVGAHKTWDEELERVVDEFCAKYNAVVIYDHTSNYKGKYGVMANLVLAQEGKKDDLNDFVLVIHLGNVSGAYLSLRMQQVWRVNQDGEICDTFRKLRYVFEMDEKEFFKGYLNDELKVNEEISQVEMWNAEYFRIMEKIPELPFSNIWIASMTAQLLPKNSVLHLGILSSLRSWNFYHVPNEVKVYSNTGGFGIDGCVSTLLGASLADSKKLYYGVVGDLAFFYDMNVLGNRQVGANLRILLINNGGGIEFKNYNHLASRFGEDSNPNIAAMGHYGNKSKLLVKNYAENLGFEYFGVSTKEEYETVLPKFVSEEITDKPMLIEVFTDSEDESRALQIINTLDGKADEQMDTRTIVRPARICQGDAKKSVVLWGTGGCFSRNLSQVEQYCDVKYACDNNASKWGKEIVSGIKCISPAELSRMKDVFVVIMLEDAKQAFQVANQLLDMNIDSFDLVYNWLQYVE